MIEKICILNFQQTTAASSKLSFVSNEQDPVTFDFLSSSDGLCAKFIKLYINHWFTKDAIYYIIRSFKNVNK